MTFRITNIINGDSFLLYADSVSEIQKQVEVELKKRGWTEADCFSEEVK